VVRAYDAVLDAWRGGKMYANRDDFIEQTAISKSMYDECGKEYLKEHFASNVNYGANRK